MKILTSIKSLKSPVGNVPWLILCIYAILMLIMPYFRGQFFDVDFYKFEFLLGVLFLMTILLYRKKDETYTFSSVIIYPLLGLVFIYFLSAMLSPVGFMAYQEAFRWLIYGLTFIGLLLILDVRRNDALLHILFVSVIWTTLFGLLAHFNLVTFTEAVIWGRIASVYQYPNTFAAIIAAGILGLLIYIIDPQKKWYYSFVYGVFLVPMFVTFIYTQSRATLVMLPIAWFVAMLFMNVMEQIKYILATLLLTCSVIPMLLIYDRYLLEDNAIIIGMLFVAGLIYSVVLIGIHRLLNKVQWSPKKRVARAIIPLLMVVVAIVGVLFLTSSTLVQLLPDTLADRLSDINLDTRSVTERGTFYKDSLAMFVDYPILGAGGNSWKVMFYTYQTLPYTSTQTHSFFMKLLVEVGALGTILFVTFILLLSYSMFRWIKKHKLQHERMLMVGTLSIMSLMLFLHSMVDFDMSYGYYSLLWFTIVAMLFVEIRDVDTVSLWRNVPLSKITMWGTVGLSIIVVIFISLNVVAMWINPEGDTFEEIQKKIETKLSLSPGNVDYKLQYLEIFSFTVTETGDSQKINDLLQMGLEMAETHKSQPVVLLQLGQFFAKYGYGINAVELSRQALEKAPWLLAAYEQYTTYATQLIQVYIENEEYEKAKEHLNTIVSWSDRLNAQIEYLKTMPETLRYPEFNLTDTLRMNLGITNVFLGHYEDAIQLLEPLRSSEDLQTLFNAILWEAAVQYQLGNNELLELLFNEGSKVSDNFEQQFYHTIILLQKLQTNL